jgi:magnesium chelatase subunit D
VEVARARLTALPTGGRTPLAAGITKALELARLQPAATTHQPLLVLVSDGRATAGGDDPVADAHAAAVAVRRAGIAAVVIDAEDGPTRLGLARPLADEMGASYFPLPALSADSLRDLIRSTNG